MKKLYRAVYVPNNFYSIYIEADSEEEAVSKAMEIKDLGEFKSEEGYIGAEYFAEEVLDA